jgi:glutathione S-transferase
MRVTVYPEDLPDRKQVERFAEALRSEYQRAQVVLDPQAVRRLVRRLLAEADALYLDGPYFVLDEEQLAPLWHLFNALDHESYIHTVPMPDTLAQREFLTRGLERAVQAGNPVPDAIWARVEEGTS